MGKSFNFIGNSSVNEVMIGISVSDVPFLFLVRPV